MEEARWSRKLEPRNHEEKIVFWVEMERGER